MTAEEWIEAFAEAANGSPPDERETGKLLKLAAVAAHSSERIAAPLACWMAGREGLELDDAIAIAERVGADGEGAGS